jgi:FkbH-like protein
MGQQVTGKVMQEPVIRRMLLVGDTTLDPLARMLERSAETPSVEVFAAPYGQIYQILLNPAHPAWAEKPDVLVVWTAPHLTLPSVGKLLRFDFRSAAAEYEAALAEVDQFADALLQAASRVGLVLVPTWILPAHERWIQTLGWRQGLGPAHLVAKANLRLAERFAFQQNIVLLDSQFWQTSLGRPAYDPRMYAVAKILYSNAFLERAAREIKSILRGSLGHTRKVVVCDLDNTLWGGVVGDDGPENLKLGAPDPVGECYQAFQSALKALRLRGILLAIASKNDEQLALKVIDEHPAMVLRKSDFVAWRINWQDKAANIVELAQDLNLGLDSFLFLDDSPQERDRIRKALPEVDVPDLPVSPSEYGPFLTALCCFETPALEKEDFERTQMYQAERDRSQTFSVGSDFESWLRSLQIEVRAASLCRESLPRATQLLNKTNQFNLSLRRMDEKSFWEWARQPSHAAYTFHVSDRFGDFGLVGLTSFNVRGTEARIIDFVMSCRVMGKQVEDALLGYTIERAYTQGAAKVLAEPVDGPRNGPAKQFFAAKYSNGGPTLLDPARATIPRQISVKEG